MTDRHYPRTLNPALRAVQNGPQPRRPANDPAIVPNPQINTRGSQESGDALDNVNPTLDTSRNVSYIGRTPVDLANNYAPQMNGAVGYTPDPRRGSTESTVAEAKANAPTTTAAQATIDVPSAAYTDPTPNVGIYDHNGNDVAPTGDPCPSSGIGTYLFLLGLGVFTGYQWGNNSK